MDPTDIFLASRSTRGRYGISAMTLYRWQRDHKLGFPHPIVVNGRKLWRLRDLEEWERAKAHDAERGRAIA